MELLLCVPDMHLMLVCFRATEGVSRHTEGLYAGALAALCAILCTAKLCSKLLLLESVL